MAGHGALHARLKKRIVAALAGDPAFAVIVSGRSWLCPYCAQVGVEDFPESPGERAEAVLQHLLEAPCVDFGEGEGSPRPLAHLEREARRRELRRRVKKELARSPSWKLLDLARRWYCPFCGEATDVVFPREESVPQETLASVVSHVEACPAAERGRARERPFEELEARARSEKRIAKLAEDVRRKLEGDPAWRRKDAGSRWICPSCQAAQGGIDLASPEAMFETAPLLIARHLLEACARGLGQRASSASEPPPPEKKTGKDRSATFEVIDDAAPFRDERSPEAHRKKSKRGKEPSPEPAFADFRREIERGLAAVRAQVPGSSVGALPPLEDTQQATARDAERACEGLPGLELRVLYRPASPPRGDFVEAIRLDERRLVVILGGVTGEDRDGSPVATMAKNLLRIHARRESDPASALRRVNAELFPDLDARSFVYAGVAVVDGKRRTVTLARAGLTPPLLVSARRDPVLRALEPEGMVMGIDRGPIFDSSLETKTVELARGDLLVLATNGVVELKGENGEELGRERFHRTVKRYGLHEVAYLIDKVGRFVEEFGRGAGAVDVCLAAIEVGSD